MAVGPQAVEDAPARRTFNLLTQRNVKKRTAFSRAPREESVNRVFSVAKRFCRSSFRLVFFEKIAKVANKSHDCHYHRPGETNKEYCFEKNYEKVHHDCLPLIPR